jgi:methionyl aminopeptidase
MLRTKVISKTSDEVSLMREAGLVVAKAHARVKDVVEPGMTTAEVESEAVAVIEREGGTPTFHGQYGFPGKVCISVNDEVIHGIPGPRRLESGDLISVDIGCTKGGFIGDSAWTYAVGEPSSKAIMMLEVGEKALYAGLKKAKGKKKLKDISKAIQTATERAGLSIVKEYTGHGVGRELHEPPQIPNWVGPSYPTNVKLEDGMTLAIEPMINEGTDQNKVLGDGWTVVTADGGLSVHFEHTVAVTNRGPLILTSLKGKERVP